MQLPSSSNITSVLKETRQLPAAARVRRRRPHVKSLAEYEKLWQRGQRRPRRLLGRAGRALHWFKPWDKVLDWNEPHAKWFVGGKLNASYNCLDRHLQRAAQEQGRHHLGGRAGRHAACCATRTCTARSASSPTCSRRWASRRATASPSTCR